MWTPTFKIAFDMEDATNDIYDNLIRLEVAEDIRKAASFVFRLSIVLEGDGEWSYLADERLAMFKRVTISIGSAERGVVTVFEGFITHLAPHFDPQEALCYLEVRGMDHTCLMSLEEKTVTWADRSHSDIASEIFNNYGIAPDVETSDIIHPEDGNVLVQRATDIRFLKDLAIKNGFDCYVTVDDSGTVRGCFKPFRLEASPLSPLAVHFEGETNVRSIDIQAAGDLPLSISGWHLSLDDRSIEQVETSEYRSKAFGKESLIDIVKAKAGELSSPLEAAGRVYKGDTVFLYASELENTIKGGLDRYGWFIKAKGVVGSEYGGVIRARSVIPVKGMGTRYSGKYLVSSVRHIVAEGDYEQHFELIRNAWGVSGDESFEIGG